MKHLQRKKYVLVWMGAASMAASLLGTGMPVFAHQNHNHHFNQPAAGWQKGDNCWHYFNNDGTLHHGWLKDNGCWYYIEQGLMKTGWLKDGNCWYYLNGSGAMATGWLKKGTTWYYLNGSGVMCTGWQKIADKWYYFYSDGSMAANCTIEGWQIGADGAMIEKNSSNQTNTNTNNTTNNNTNNNGGGTASSSMIEPYSPNSKWVININSNKIHYHSCNEAAKIKDYNKRSSNRSVEELRAAGYSTCKRCFGR